MISGHSTTDLCVRVWVFVMNETKVLRKDIMLQYSRTRTWRLSKALPLFSALEGRQPPSLNHQLLSQGSLQSRRCTT